MAKQKIHNIISKPQKEELKIRIKLEQGALMPEYAHEGDAGLDLFSNESLVIYPHHRAPIKTGVFLELPEGYVGLIKDKSGMALNFGMHVIGGVIDSGYRGEYIVTLINLSSKPFVIKKGMKIAQLLIQKVEKAVFEKVEELEATARGSGNFGSTGLKKTKPRNPNLLDIKKAVE